MFWKLTFRPPSAIDTLLNEEVLWWALFRIYTLSNQVVRSTRFALVGICVYIIYNIYIQYIHVALRLLLRRKL